MMAIPTDTIKPIKIELNIGYFKDNKGVFGTKTNYRVHPLFIHDTIYETITGRGKSLSNHVQILNVEE